MCECWYGLMCVYVCIYYLVFSVDVLELFGHLQSPVRAVVVNDDYLIVVTTDFLGEMFVVVVVCCLLSD